MNFLAKWLDERTGLATGFEKVTHWTVPASRCCCRFLPVAILFAFLMQGLTGIFLWAFYAPSAQTAWESVYFIQYEVPFGWLVRGIHHYSAQLLVGMLGIYLLMKILHGAYRTPREFVYWSAVVMFLFSLGSCLTGDLLMWSQSGYFATIARVSFLQLLPVIGLPLYQLAVGGPDPQFGTFTLTRFLVLHVAVFGGGGFCVMLFWKWCDIRSRALSCEKGISHGCALACATQKQRPFWSTEALLAGCVCVMTMAAILALVFQHSQSNAQLAHRAKTLPAESYLGAELTAPADSGGSYDAARPEWSFRALYHMSKLPIFSKIGMIFAIFVIPGCLLAYFFAIPILARIPGLHYLIVPTTLTLFGVFCWFTYLSYWDDYRNPDHAPSFLASKGEAELAAQRAIELCQAQAGIPATGALTLLKNDPFIQGPKLFSQHCASCHSFEPFGNIPASSDFAPIATSDTTAPNLYGAPSVEWIGGFLDADRIVSDDYFGKTDHFAVKGSMITYLKGRVFGGMTQRNGAFILNTSDGLIASLIDPSASPAFDILEAAFEKFAQEPDAEELLKNGAYLPKFKESLAAQFADTALMAGLKPTLPEPVVAALRSVLLDMVDDDKFAELLRNEENIALIQEGDAAEFLTDTYLATLCGNDEPIAPEELQYIERLRAGIMAVMTGVAEILYEESQLETPRVAENGSFVGLRPNATTDFAFLTCTECHAFYGVEKDQACDLRGYMSRDWVAGFIAEPTLPKFYGKKNDRMPAYHPATGDPLMRADEIQRLAEWIHGQWYRAPDAANTSRLGENAEILPNALLEKFRPAK